MHFHKQPSPDCLAPMTDLKVIATGDGAAELSNGRETVRLTALKDGVFHLQVNRLDDPLPQHTPALANVPGRDTSAAVNVSENVVIVAGDTTTFRLQLDQLAFGLEHRGNAGGGEAVDLIALDPTQIIGFNGTKFGIGVRMPEDTPYYGFGEKTGPLNKHGQRMKFWNVDVCADHPYGCTRDDYDPTYCAIPVAIFPVTNENGVVSYAAILIDNGGPTWFNCQTNDFLEERFFYFGSYAGEPGFYFITGSTMAEVCVKLSRLTGAPQMPPLWSLGHHQCRWGYDEERMYQHIVEQYEEHDIPLSAFWLDIDYMDRYRVFSWHDERVPDPKGLMDWMHEKNVRLVTIIDPGVSAANGNGLYEEGREKDIFCQAPSGREFIGMVWPGKTAFPDFSLPEGREWWATHLASHLSLGVDGIWNDMNDPAAGACDLDDMLFARGKIDHVYGHNLYGTWMAEATCLGYQKARPEERPFILTRSASTGIQQFAAVWTGDNCSSWAHLKMAISETINLSLSGVSFNGPDIGGFMDNTTGDLLTRWYQAAILFPFYRNHANNGTAHQEPWCFGTPVREVIRDAINFRYRLLGYLYTQFADHLETGEPVMRSLSYFDPDRKYRDVADTYAIGSQVIVAPIVTEGTHRRYIILPPGLWFDTTRGEWFEGSQIFERDVPFDDVPVFVREETIICEPVPEGGSFVGWDADLSKNVAWRLHVFGAEAQGSQLIDDGRSSVPSIPKPVTIQAASDGALGGTFPFEKVESLIWYGPAPEDPVVGGRVFQPVGEGQSVEIGGRPLSTATTFRPA